MDVLKKIHKEGIGQQGQIAAYAIMAAVAACVMLFG